jgi:hypothetical protein
VILTHKFPVKPFVRIKAYLTVPKTFSRGELLKSFFVSAGGPIDYMKTFAGQEIEIVCMAGILFHCCQLPDKIPTNFEGYLKLFAHLKIFINCLKVSC